MATTIPIVCYCFLVHEMFLLDNLIMYLLLMKEMGLKCSHLGYKPWSQINWVQILELTRYMALGQLLFLSQPQFPTYNMGIM